MSELRGVISVTPGYSGGHVDHPSYEEVCSGRTGHAEVVEVEFDPAVISYHQLLEVFFFTHDPIQINRQGHDIGEQYRSVIFYQDESQKSAAEKIIQDLNRQKIFSKPIATRVEPFTNFFPAEDDHREYYRNHPNQPYCQLVIDPKLAKFRKRFQSLRKQGSDAGA